MDARAWIDGSERWIITIRCMDTAFFVGGLYPCGIFEETVMAEWDLPYTPEAFDKYIY